MHISDEPDRAATANTNNQYRHLTALSNHFPFSKNKRSLDIQTKGAVYCSRRKAIEERQQS